jgi:hypothetical protein
MSVLRTYKRHIKPATDLFWIPADGNGEIQHWQFDDQQQLIHRETFRTDDPDQTIGRLFAGRVDCSLGNESLVNSESNALLSTKAERCTVLQFPVGFSLDIGRTASVLLPAYCMGFCSTFPFPR